jgi:CRP-like cAMP-binding protein
MSGENLLSGFKFFAGAAPATLNKIASRCEVFEFERDQVIFYFEDPAKYLYGLLEGEVDLILIFMDKVLKTEVEYEKAVHAKMVDKEKQITVDTVTPGKIFGWASLVGPAKRTVTAKCSEPSRVLAIPAEFLKSLLDNDPSFGYLFMQKMSDMISKRLKNRTERLVEVWVEAFDTDQI